ncbi:hypothetical protein [Pontivivens insulae]|uniref:Uncharacterized protein n=1 Tax=Pontivivens insulae TaxID=1639689 RepID=A0A2R8ACL6_9RHOB|nr:hypothetical protein [Pontivivens insulae]RED13922.1 hypothetical protein DFR53_1270 [Pontivivens insulae]SPF29996.1 hypothetical protein POI8812_02323 [Pontivivens insulae]
MDFILAEAVSQIAQLPQNKQREIGMVLLNGEVPPQLPVIQFEPDASST